MAWDLALDPLTHQMTGSIVTGDDEIIQRLWLRLNKELGEWFLNVESGLPWYQDGYGILGAKPSRRNDIDLVLRRCIADTDGVSQILYFRSLYAGGTRAYTVNVKALLSSGAVQEFNVTADMANNSVSVQWEA